MYKIAILGKANSGKNTVANLIIKGINQHSNSLHSNKLLAFADPIKEMIKIMFPQVKRKHLYGSSKYRDTVIVGAKDKSGNPLTIRQLLIDIGTGLGRGYNSNVWIENFAHRLEKHKNTSIVIVPDIRFKDEFEYLKNNNFFILKIIRDTKKKINHISETDQDGIPDAEFDYIIDNNGPLSNLINVVQNQLVRKII